VDDRTVDDTAQRVHTAIVAGDWPAVRELLHPYLHWTDGAGQTVRGRTKVMAMLMAAGQAPAAARSVELRDGQLYRWNA
jgi:hypothetical protein